MNNDTRNILFYLLDIVFAHLCALIIFCMIHFDIIDMGKRVAACAHAFVNQVLSCSLRSWRKIKRADLIMCRSEMRMNNNFFSWNASIFFKKGLYKRAWYVSTIDTAHALFFK